MKRRDAAKRQEWELRLARFEADHRTVAQFCRDEQVSVAGFYYWRRQCLGVDKIPGDGDRSAARAPHQPANQTPRGATEGPLSASVQFQFANGALVSVPAQCLDALRCLVECVRREDPIRSGGFQQVVVRRS